MRIDEHCVVRRGDQHVETSVDGETFMMSLAQNRYFAVADTGLAIWERLQGPTLISDVIDGLVRDYEVDRAQCADEVVAFVNQLSERGLVVRV